MGCIFVENGPLESGIESSFSGAGWGAKGDFRWIFYPNPCVFERGPYHFPNAHALRYGHRKFGDDRMYIRGEWVFRIWSPCGDFKWICGPYACICEGDPLYFQKAHALRYMYRKLQNVRMYIRGEWILRRWH